MSPAPRPVFDPRLRQLGERKTRETIARGQGSWWATPKAQGSREEFSAEQRARAEDLKYDQRAAKVKSKMNFVER